MDATDIDRERETIAGGVHEGIWVIGLGKRTIA